MTLTEITNETEWNVFVWESITDKHFITDFDQAENDLLDTMECDSEEVQHLRSIGVI